MKRPMLYWAVLFILGEIFYKFLSVNRFFICIIAMAVSAYFVMAVLRCRNNLIVWFGIIFFIGGIALTGYNEKKLLNVSAYFGKSVPVNGRIIQKLENRQGISYVIRIYRLSGKRVNVKALMDVDNELSLGDIVELKALTSDFSTATNPGEYDEKSYRNGNGILIKLNDVSLIRKISPDIGVMRCLDKLHNGLKSNYEKLFDESRAGLSCAMVLGDKSMVDADIKKLYQRNGIAHLIAISGLHIAMIGGLLYRLFRRQLGDYGKASAIGIAFILAYGAMTGLSASTVRAMIMLIVGIGADVFGRKYDSVTALSLALVVMLALNPCQITQAGFILSFGAVVGIAVVNPVWEHIFSEIPKYIKGLLISVSVQLAIVPIMLYFFYEIPVYGVLLNIVVVPAMGVLLAMLILCGLLDFICVPAAEIAAFFAKTIFVFYEMLCKCAEKLPFHTLCTGRPSALWIICYYGMLVLFLLIGYGKININKKFLILILVAQVMSFALFEFPGNMLICMFDVGQGDGIYIRTPEKINILMDAGSSTKKKIGRYVIGNGIKYYGADIIDYAFVSHLDNDHISGIKELIDSGEIAIKNLVLPGILNPDEEYRELEALANKAGCNIIYMVREDCIKIGDVTFYCLNPENREYSDKNSSSLVFDVSYKSFDMLFTGDITEDTERELAYLIKNKVEVLKVSHHGSRTASGEEFVKGLSPAVALVSVGARNSYGHPSGEVMETLSQYCSKIYLTKDCGAITIYSDGIEFSVSEFLENSRK